MVVFYDRLSTKPCTVSGHVSLGKRVDEIVKAVERAKSKMVEDEDRKVKGSSIFLH
jgi:hypothetical protein